MLSSNSLRCLNVSETHIGLNLVYMVPGETGGTEIVARELIPVMLALAPEGMRFTAFVNREAARAGDGPWGHLLPSVTVPVHSRNRYQWVLGEQAFLPVLGARARIKLMHSLANTAPLWGPFLRVVTVHDLIYALYPETHAGNRAQGLSVLVPQAIKHADRVMADSESTRKDLLEMTSARAECVDVVPLGLGTVQRVQPVDEGELRAKFDLGQRPILLSLSAKRPHKNLLALIGALARLSLQERPILILPGYATTHEAELRDRALSLGVEQDVRFPAWLSDAELEGLWKISRVFLFPSLYEGFGMPVLEAMSRGVPVACADASSLPEVVGDAALLFDPRSEDDIAAALQRLLENPALCEQLRIRGLEQAKLFTWERMAKGVLASYARALGTPAPAPPS